MSSYKSLLSSSPPFRNAFGSVEQAACGQPSQALAACEQKLSVFAGLGNVFAPAHIHVLPTMLRSRVSQVLEPPAGLQHSSTHASDLQDTGNTRLESTVAWPLPCTAPQQAAGLAVGPAAERFSRTLASYDQSL